jgi:murein L,D-transpeptidase YcbB/YkuD
MSSSTASTAIQHHLKQKEEEYCTMSLFRSALAINNNGVSLLEKGHFREAQKTFREALTFMKQAIKPPSRSPSSCRSSSSSTSTIVEETLQSVATRLIRAQANPILSAFEICAFEDGDDLSHIFQSSLKYGPSSSLFFPFRIRGGSSSSQDPTFCHVLEKEMHRPMAILLYNQALSHLLWGQSGMLARIKVVQEKHFQAALSCLSTAQSVLSQHLKLCGVNKKKNKDRFQQQCSMPVQAFVVNNLVQVLRIKNRLGLLPLEEQREQEQESSSQKSLEDWIQVRDNLLQEYESLDEHSKNLATYRGLPCSSAATAA